MSDWLCATASATARGHGGMDSTESTYLTGCPACTEGTSYDAPAAGWGGTAHGTTCACACDCEGVTEPTVCDCVEPRAEDVVGTEEMAVSADVTGAPAVDVVEPAGDATGATADATGATVVGDPTGTMEDPAGTTGTAVDPIEAIGNLGVSSGAAEDPTVAA